MRGGDGPGKLSEPGSPEDREEEQRSTLRIAGDSEGEVAASKRPSVAFSRGGPPIGLAPTDSGPSTEPKGAITSNSTTVVSTGIRTEAGSIMSSTSAGGTSAADALGSWLGPGSYGSSAATAASSSSTSYRASNLFLFAGGDSFFVEGTTVLDSLLRGALHRLLTRWKSAPLAEGGAPVSEALGQLFTKCP